MADDAKDRPRGRILVIDDEEIVLKSCRVVLQQEGYEVETRRSGPDGLNLLRDRPFDLVLCDLKMPMMSGIEVLRHIKENSPQVSVVIITGYATVSSAVETLRGGAADYVTKPFTPRQLAASVEAVMLRRREEQAAGEETEVLYASPGIIGESPKMQEVFKLVAKVARSATTVLVRGESGAGKEVIARAIHAGSPRGDGPFVAVDSGAIPETLVESELFGHTRGAFTGADAAKAGAFRTAHGGTLFLDEVGNLSVPAQMKLLRAIEEKQIKPVGSDKVEKVDVRLVAATNCDLEKMVQEGRYREDLFWRLSVFVISIPPLRERREDIPLLAMHFLKKHADEAGRNVKRFSAEAMTAMIGYDWPGNVRELASSVLRALHMAEGETIMPGDLPDRVCSCAREAAAPRTSQELKRAKKEAREKSTEQIERVFVIDALERSGWNVTKAAEDVGMARQNFQALMRKHGITSRE
jgi:DNA-binding NtrC family response regulator